MRTPNILLMLTLIQLGISSHMSFHNDLLLVDEDGEPAFLPGRTLHADMNIQIEIDPTMKAATADITKILNAYCSTIPAAGESALSEKGTVREHRRGKRAVPVIPTMAITIGEFIDPSLAVGHGITNLVMDTRAGDEYMRQNLERDRNLRELLERTAVKEFSDDLNTLFSQGKLQGSFLKGESKELINKIGASSILDAHLRLNLAVISCDVDNLRITTKASWTDPDTAIHGRLYHVVDPGEISEDKKTYSYYELPEFVFVSKENKVIETDGCVVQRGGVQRCSAKKEENICSVLDFRETCPLRAYTVSEDWELARPYGDFILLVSMKTHFKMVDGSKGGLIEDVGVPRSAIWGMRLDVEDKILIDGKWHSGTNQGTEVIIVEVSQPHKLPAEIEGALAISSSTLLSSMKLRDYESQATTAFMLDHTT